MGAMSLSERSSSSWNSTKCPATIDLGKSVPSKWFSLSRGTTVNATMDAVTRRKSRESNTLECKIQLQLSLEMEQ